MLSYDKNAYVKFKFMCLCNNLLQGLASGTRHIRQRGVCHPAKSFILWNMAKTFPRGESLDSNHAQSRFKPGGSHVMATICKLAVLTCGD